MGLNTAMDTVAMLAVWISFRLLCIQSVYQSVHTVLLCTMTNTMNPNYRWLRWNASAVSTGMANFCTAILLKLALVWCPSNSLIFPLWWRLLWLLQLVSHRHRLQFRSSIQPMSNAFHWPASVVDYQHVDVCYSLINLRVRFVRPSIVNLLILFPSWGMVAFSTDNYCNFFRRLTSL